MNLREIKVGDLVILNLNLPNRIVKVKKIENNLVTWDDGDIECSCIPEFIEKKYEEEKEEKI